MKLTQDNLRKAQLLMLKILKEVHRICEENNIKYFLCYGTLLGAIRHQGFIPWDDDCDIGMFRDDYEKFLNVVDKSLSSEFILQTENTDDGYGFEFSKIMLKDTLWIETNVSSNMKRKNCGIFVDIFPFDKLPCNTLKAKICSFVNDISQILILKKLNYTIDTNSIIKKILLGLLKVVAFFIPYRLLKKIRKKIRTKNNKYETKFYVNYDDYSQSIVNYNDVFELKKMNFEGFSFYVPNNYDKILKRMYGDYMVLPPKDERVSHGIMKYDFGRYYE